MKRLMLAGWVLVLAGAAVTWGQTAATGAAATQVGPADWKKEIAEKTIANPDYEKLIAKMPANLLPPKGQEPDKGLARMKAARDWDKDNADGKPIKVTVVVKNGMDAEFYLPGEAMRRVQMRAMATNAFGGISPGGRAVVEGTIGKGSVLVSKNTWPDGEVVYEYNLVVVNPKVTAVASTQPAPAVH
jgi:hypothetical protein